MKQRGHERLCNVTYCSECGVPVLSVPVLIVAGTIDQFFRATKFRHLHVVVRIPSAQTFPPRISSPIEHFHFSPYNPIIAFLQHQKHLLYLHKSTWARKTEVLQTVCCGFPPAISSVHHLLIINFARFPLDLLSLNRLCTTPLQNVFTTHKISQCSSRDVGATTRMHFNALRQPLHDFHISVDFSGLLQWFEDVCV